MKLLKKLIASVCAFSMIASMTAMTVVNAEEYTQPGIKLDLVSYDKTTGEGQIGVSMEGISSVGPAVLMNFDIFVFYDEGSFDQSLWSTSGLASKRPLNKNLVGASNVDGFLTKNNVTNESKLSAVYLDANSEIIEDQQLFTLNFKVTDTSKENKLTLKNCRFTYNVYDENYNTVVKPSVAYVQNQGTLSYNGDVVIKPEDVSIVIPPATGATATGDAIKNLNVVYGDADDPIYADTEAASALANLKVEGAVNAAKFTLSRKNAEGATEEMQYEENLANLEVGDLTLGVIVQYTKGEYTDVVITGMELK